MNQEYLNLFLNEKKIKIDFIKLPITNEYFLILKIIHYNHVR